MTDERGLAGRTFTHAEMDLNIASLYGVGGVYELLAQIIEQHERPNCTGELTNIAPPWHGA